MSIKSEIKTSERVENKDRHFGSAMVYFPVYIIDDTGKKMPALFTQSQLNVAVERASRNMEDMPDDSSWFDWLS